MKIGSNSFDDGQPIPDRFAFGVPDATEHMALGDNRNPSLTWSDVPDEAKSLVLICIDTDVPSSGEHFNREGVTVPAELARVDFFHWAMVDIPASDGGLEEGACSSGVTPGGKADPDGPAGSRQGINDYTGFMSDNPDMKGDYFGYDGPCPPWNDEIVHHYHFALYATDLERCPVEGRFTGADVLTAIEGHILAEARITGTYALNPELRKT